MKRTDKTLWAAAAISGWALFTLVAMLLWLTYAKLQARIEEAWSLSNRLTVTEMAYAKVEKQLEKYEGMAAQRRMYKAMRQNQRARSQQ